ncbi:MAG TPA: hypothetical protein VMX16_04350 [Terriglobia bacterium]|nr:hypothetical protein [Terriglobia bacterium]
MIPHVGVSLLLVGVLPVADTLSALTIRNPLLGTAMRMETELEEEKPVFLEGTGDDWERQPIPKGSPPHSLPCKWLIRFAALLDPSVGEKEKQQIAVDEGSPP